MCGARNFRVYQSTLTAEEYRFLRQAQARIDAQKEPDPGKKPSRSVALLNVLAIPGDVKQELHEMLTKPARQKAG